MLSEVGVSCFLTCDDGSLGSSVDDIVHDLDIVKTEGARLGLQLNKQNSETICSNDSMRGLLLCAFPGARFVPPENATLLGSSIGKVQSISSTLQNFNIIC